MKVGVNLLNANSGALYSASIDLIRSLRRQTPTDTLVAFLSANQRDLLRELPEAVCPVICRLNNRRWISRLLLDQLWLPAALTIHKIDVLYSTNTAPLVSPCPIFLSLEAPHPFSMLGSLWSFKQRVRLWILRHLTKWSARRAAKVRFVSESSRQIIVKKIGISLTKTLVIPNGFNQSLIPSATVKREDFSNRDRRILAVSDLAAYKNIHRLMEAFDRLEAWDDRGYQLMIAGRFLDESYKSRLIDLRTQLIHGSSIEFLGNVASSRLGGIYQQADLVVYPSLEETFGLPILEALVLGTPVAASDCRALSRPHFNPFPELFGDALFYFNPMDVDDMARAMARAMLDPLAKTKARESGERLLKKYNWDAVAREILGVMRLEAAN